MENLQDLKRRASALESSGQHEAALECYLRALAQDADDANLIARTGVVQLRLHRLDDAAGNLARATELYTDAGLRNIALALCHMLLREDPERADFLLRLGQLSAEQGYREDAH